MARPRTAGGTPLVNPPRFKPSRDRYINVRSIECPTCKAGIGQPCRKLDGTEGRVQHDIRRRLVIRAENEARFA